MNPLRSRALPRALGALALVAASVAVAAPAHAAGEPCTVSGATLDWGFKESFRAYIDGSIANGEWTTDGGASYATPTFTWSDGTAEIDPDAHTAEVTFAGSVRFTGHDGILDTTIADPVIRISPDGTATVLLDVSGPTMDGDPIDEADVPFVTAPVNLADLATDGPQTIVLTAPVLTEQGSTAFPNYEAGTPFDDVTVTVPTTAECRIEGSADTMPLWVMAGAATGVLAVGIAVLVATLRRRKQVTDA